MRRSTAATAAIGALLGAGCGPAPYTIGPEPPGPPVQIVITEARPLAPEPPDRWFPDDLPRLNPFVQQRTWLGEYDCAQGRTGLALRILDAREDRVQAIFEFNHAPTGVSGKFLMAGTVDEKTGAVVLWPGAWLVRPDDYVTVGMEGVVSRDGTRFTGRIPFPGCGGFRLRAGR